MHDYSYFIKIFIGLLALVNPFEAMPMFISGTKDLTRQQKVLVAKKTYIAVFLILVFSQYLGRYLLEMFGISTASFSLAGGVIIFVIALQMVIGESDPKVKSLPDAEGNNNFSAIGIVPIAMPLLAGPGPISSIVVYGSRSTGLAYDISLTFIVFLISTVAFLTLYATSRFEKILTPTSIKIITKISGLFVAAIAVEIMYTAILGLINSAPSH